MRPSIALASGLAAAAAFCLQPAPSRADAAPPSPAPVSMTLDDAISTALANDLAYRAAQADVNAAAARVVQATGGRFPSLSAGYAHEHTQSAGAFVFPSPAGPVNFPISATKYDSVNETVQWAIYTGGAVEAQVGAADAGYAAAKSSYAAARADAIRQTTDAYFHLVEARKAAAIADQAVAVAQDDLKTADELFAAGTAARADVLRQQVTLANAQVQQIKAADAASLANADLANVLDIDLGSTIEPTEPLDATAPSFALGALLAAAHDKRGELQAARSALSIADETVKAARAGTLPIVALTVQNAGTTPNFENIPQPQLSETLSVTWRLFDGGMTHGKAAEATAEVDKAKINLKQLENRVDLEVRDAFFNYAAAKAELDAARFGQASADENLRVARLRYRSGVGTSLELSDALLADTQAQNQFVDSQANLRVTLVALRRAAGLL